MHTTLELLDKALAVAETESALSRDLGLHRTTIAAARRTGRLSPTLAGQIAQRLDTDPAPWIALAGLEASKPSRVRDALVRKVVANLRI